MSCTLTIGKESKSTFKFDPTKQYGNYVFYTEESPEIEIQIRRLLYNQIKEVIPLDYWNGITFIKKRVVVTDEDGEIYEGWSRGWKYTPVK